MVNLDSHQPVDITKKGKAVIAALDSQRKFNLQAYRDSGELQQTIQQHGSIEVVRTLVQKLPGDETRAQQTHATLLRLFIEWRGDLEKELRLIQTGQASADKILNYYR